MFPPSIAKTPKYDMDLPLDDMQATGRFHNPRDLTGLQGKGGLLKGLLHVSFAKVTQIAALAGTTAVGLGNRQLGQGLFFGLDNLLVILLDDLSSFCLGAGDFVGFPARRPARLVVLDQQMGGADLALATTCTCSSSAGGGTVVFGHVDLEFIGVGSWWGFPAAVAIGRVEVVRKVLGLTVAHLPVGWEAGLGLVVEDEGHC